MKKIFGASICFVLLLFLCSCGATPVDELTPDERELYDALLVMSDSFFNPSELRLLDAGDSAVSYIYETEEEERLSGACNSVVVRVQGENKSGGVSNDYYRLNLTSLAGRDLAEIIAGYDFDNSTYWRENWDECGEDEYPRNNFETFADYRQNWIDYDLKNSFYHTQDALDKAAEEEAKKSWDSSKDDEYPRSSYSSYESYLEFYLDYAARNDYVVKDYDKTVLASRGSLFGSYEPLEVSSITSSEEDKYDVSKINKALKYYWDKKLGNDD